MKRNEQSQIKWVEYHWFGTLQSYGKDRGWTGEGAEHIGLGMLTTICGDS